MTNEELAVAYQNNRERDGRHYLVQLWEQNEGLLALMAVRFYAAYPERCARAGLTENDLKQETYFAFLDAVKAFDAKNGYKFVTYLKYPIKNRFETLLGVNRGKRNPLNECTSLDCPVDGEEGLERSELVEDEYQIAALECVEISLYIEQMHKDLEKAMASLSARERDVLRMKYFKGLTLQEIGVFRGASRQAIAETASQAIRKMRYPQRMRYLRQYCDDMRSHNYFVGTGLRSWTRTCASSVELAAEQAELYTRHKGIDLS